jgi:hypothetical protein
MKRIISPFNKIALWPGGQLLQDHFWKDIEENLWGRKPHYRSTEDSGSPKKTIMYPGMGSRWRENNPGAGGSPEQKSEEEPRRGIGSGYNDGERPDVDEQGPGFSRKLPEPEWAINSNELFLNLDMMNQGDNNANNEFIRKNLKKILESKPVVYRPKRYPVDHN